MAVNTKHDLYLDKVPEWRLMEDSLKGELAIKYGERDEYNKSECGDAWTEGEVYLPKTSGMIEAEKSARATGDPHIIADARKLYLAYKLRAEYPLWVKDSLRAMVGLVSRCEPVADMPPRMQALIENSTSDGFSLNQLYLRTVRALLAKGRAPLLADFDDAGNPYIATYTAESAINWRERAQGGRNDLILAVFEELRETEDSSEFDPQYETVFRVLDSLEGVYHSRVMTESGDVLEDAYPGRTGGGTSRPLTYIPAVYAGTTDNDPAPDEIPLLTMAKSAIMYYRLSADYYQSMHHTAHPQPVISGIRPTDDMRVTGPMVAWTLEDPTAKAYYLEFAGAGLGAVRQAMQDQRQAASESGAKVVDIGTQESGDAREARQDDQHSALYSVCKNAAAAIEQVLRYLADWMGIDPEQVHYTIEPKFTSDEVDAAMLKVISDITLSGGAPREVLYETLRRGGITDMDDETLTALTTTEVS